MVFGSLYGAVVTWRRRWYAGDPARVRRLARPVISVGNLRTGGSGKTPIVACIARFLLSRGERPAILTRGYGRPNRRAGTTVVSDGRSVRSGFADAGDEPLMLARALPGVAVVVGADRFASGRLAESELGATVHILDDGFQHLTLARDVDLLLVDESDLTEPMLPAGRLREPLSNAGAADALLVTAKDMAEVERISAALGVEPAFRVDRRIGDPVWQDPGTGPERPPYAWKGGDGEQTTASPALAFAGIARAERFFSDLRAAGHFLANTVAFHDHHVYSQADMADLVVHATRTGATHLLTTAKDGVRLERLRLELPWAIVPLSVGLEPEDAFEAWLVSRIGRA